MKTCKTFKPQQEAPSSTPTLLRLIHKQERRAICTFPIENSEDSSILLLLLNQLTNKSTFKLNPSKQNNKINVTHSDILNFLHRDQ